MDRGIWAYKTRSSSDKLQSQPKSQAQPTHAAPNVGSASTLSHPQGPISAFDPGMRLHLHELVLTFGKQLNVRQRAIATTEIYLIRFLLRVSLHEVNIYVVISACLYLACKVEESPLHLRTITSEARILWPDFVTADPTKVAECEFYLIEELETYLIVHHPYRSLKSVSAAISMEYPQFSFTATDTQSIHSMINDSYASDMLLIYAPHVIAMAAIYMVTVLKSPVLKTHQTPQAIKERIDLLVQFIGRSGVDLEQLAQCVQEFVCLYARWESYDEGLYRAYLAKLLL